MGSVVPPSEAATDGAVPPEVAGAGVVDSVGPVNADGTPAEELVPPGTAWFEGISWLEAATPRASTPASTIAAGAASFFTITPRMLVAPTYGRGCICPGL